MIILGLDDATLVGAPEGVFLGSIADLQSVVPCLADRGYEAADIEGIMHANWIRYLREIWS